MANKTKTNKTIASAQEIAAGTGILLMTAATMLGLVEVPVDHERKAILPAQPAFAFANPVAEQEAQGNQLRREREEVGPHYVSYSVNMRTPGRTGKI